MNADITPYRNRTNTHSDPSRPNASIANGRTSRRGSWWMELLMVDFHHSFWPWLAYVTATFCLAYRDQLPNSLWFLFIGYAGWSAVVAQVFCADQAHRTLEALLSFPRRRVELWLLRLGFLFALMTVPLMAAFLFSPARDAVAMLALFCWCALTVGSLMTILLRSPLLAWSTIFISPLALIIICSALIELLGLDSNGSFTDDFPYAPLNFLFFFLTTGIVCALAAWRLWLRLEVRS